MALIRWFEIPALNLSRAKNFYSKLLEEELEIQDFEGAPVVFLKENGENKGALVQAINFKAVSSDVTIVYFDSKGKIDEMLERATLHGGEILIPKSLIKEGVGHFAWILDSEGNRIGIFG